MSLATMVGVLWFQQSAMGSKIWDFQGAADAATVVPSFAGVLLAGWAIYFQIRTSAPSYKAAEQTWMDISELYHRALKVGALLKTVEVGEPNDLPGLIDYDPNVDQVPPESEFSANARRGRRWAVERCANEFRVSPTDTASPARTMASLALSVFSVLETLQHSLPDLQTVDLIKIETDIDFVGATYANDFDYPQQEAWMKKTSGVLRRVVELTERLAANGLLNVDTIKNALRNPALSKSIRSWFEGVEAVEHYRDHTSMGSSA
jgi:hypothetical protein